MSRTWHEAVANLSRYSPCSHENWERGGAIWRICQDCGAHVEEGHEEVFTNEAELFDSDVGVVSSHVVQLEAESARLRSELDHLRGWRDGAEFAIERLKVDVNELSLALSTLLDHIESNEGKVRPGEQCPNCTGVGPGEPVEACPYHDAWLALSIHG